MAFAAAVAVLLLCLGRVLYDVESQDNPYLSIRKQEYRRVLKNIYAQEITNMNMIRRRTNLYGDAGGQRKDSFVHLLETIERRESKFRYANSATSALTGGQGGYDPTGAKHA
eukprot:g5785.t1